jgi:hypothetical protein
MLAQGFQSKRNKGQRTLVLLADREEVPSVTTRLKNINPVQCGIVVAVMEGLISLVFVIFAIPISMMAQSALHPSTFSPILLIFFPVIYAVLGFLIGVITAWIYNVVAGFTGGIELRFESTQAGVPELG